MRLLNAVSVTDNATSPPASMENTLLELPPGQQAMSTTPTKNTGFRCMAHANPNANTGSTTSCPNKPTSTGRGERNKRVKSSNLSVSPKSNINTNRIGITMNIVLIY